MYWHILVKYNKYHYDKNAICSHNCAFNVQNSTRFQKSCNLSVYACMSRHTCTHSVYACTYVCITYVRVLVWYYMHLQLPNSSKIFLSSQCYIKVSIYAGFPNLVYITCTVHDGLSHTHICMHICVQAYTHTYKHTYTHTHTPNS